MDLDNIKQYLEIDENGKIKYNREIFVALYGGMLNKPKEFVQFALEEPSIIEIVSEGITDLFNDIEKEQGNLLSSIGLMLNLCSYYGQTNLLGVDISSVNEKSLKSRQCDDIIQQLIDKISNN